MSSVPRPLLVGARDSAEGDACRAERARREVAALYSERAAEFFHYAQALARNQELARDALQEAFMRYFIALCEGQEISSARAWMYRVLHNYVLDRIRERRPVQEDNAGYRRASAPNVEDDYFQREVLHLVERSLTSREYACIRLRTEGLRYDEIATRLELSSGAVGSLISRAVRKLRAAMGLKEESE